METSFLFLGMRNERWVRANTCVWMHPRCPFQPPSQPPVLCLLCVYRCLTSEYCAVYLIVMLFNYCAREQLRGHVLTVFSVTFVHVLRSPSFCRSFRMRVCYTELAVFCLLYEHNVDLYFIVIPRFQLLKNRTESRKNDEMFLLIQSACEQGSVGASQF
jgi:hypothetical protein